MKNLETDKQAAYHYLKAWQAEESPNPEEATPHWDAIEELEYPTDPIFDNEAEPLIIWADPNFNYQEYIKQFINK